MLQTQAEVLKALMEVMVSEKTADKTAKSYVLKAGTKAALTSEQVRKIYEDNKQDGDILPKHAAHAASRWVIWSPNFKASLVGNTLRVTVLVSHERNISDAEESVEVSAPAPKIKIKPKEIKKDPDFYVMPKESEYVEKAIAANRNIFLAGPAGCGKTSMLELLLKKNKREYERVNLDGDFTKSDFVGDWILKSEEGNPEMVYNEGILTTCMREGKALILDELDAAPQEVLFTIQAVLEGKPLVNTKTGERISAKEGFTILATANTVGKGDFSTMYSGTRLLNEATLDRFHYILRMGYPDANTEAKILMQRTGIGHSWAKQISKLSESVRRMAQDGKIYSTFSIRKSLNFASALMDEVEAMFAFRATILDRLSEEDASIISDAAQRIINYKTDLLA